GPGGAARRRGPPVGHRDRRAALADPRAVQPDRRDRRRPRRRPRGARHPRRRAAAVAAGVSAPRRPARLTLRLRAVTLLPMNGANRAALLALAILVAGCPQEAPSEPAV